MSKQRFACSMAKIIAVTVVVLAATVATGSVAAGQVAAGQTVAPHHTRSVTLPAGRR